jgi:hypothetical protein
MAEHPHPTGRAAPARCHRTVLIWGRKPFSQ